MKVVFFDAKPYDEVFFKEANKQCGWEMDFHEVHLSEVSVGLAKGYEAVCIFVNDKVNGVVLEKLTEYGVKVLALRCAGFNNVDLKRAKELGMPVVRVPAYSPHAVAEHTLALVLTLNRKTHRAFNRVRENNFSIDGLMGFDIYGKTAGVVGTGKIGAIVARIFKALGCDVLAYDVYPQRELEEEGIRYVGLDEVYAGSDIITLHCPLSEANRHMINEGSIGQMKEGVMLINTSRGGLIDTKAVIEGLKSRKVGYLGLDVYEEEEGLFFYDRSGELIQDDTFSRLLTLPNVLVTGHQAFFTREALRNIAETTLSSINECLEGKVSGNAV